MRESKFRAQRVDNNQWAYGYYCYNSLTNKAHIYAFDEKRSYVYEVISETVGQYIGLKDKTAKEIYDGDIVRVFKFINDSDLPEDGELEFIQDAQVKMMFTMQLPHWSLVNLYGLEIEYVGWFDRLEVIGNIYQNPELIKGE